LFSVIHGIIAKVFGSGFNRRSESLMLAKPIIDEPSNFGSPSLICSDVNVLAEIVV
jgi:hypothetical protein